MADFDWGNLAGNLLNAGVGYLNNQMQLKQAKKLAKASAPRGGFPMLGFSGGMMTPAVPGWGTAAAGVGVLGGALGELGLDPNNPQSYLGQAVDAIQGQSCQKFKLAQSQRAVPISLISDVNPSTGRTHWWRHVGQPILFSGDVSHCRRVNKLLSKQTRRCGSRRPR